ncbi:uncharacterized protein LOC117641058 isoform X2 [Thrips palmi]|uniref:Uncharacterized protein LOC117641058 isoform X2 n=1 Tax=Thrips palmi TaxID=161013 RepID=A0A6P8ZIR2_THRPL|nr:uncharacterized protein LOC117641058 isoform X2 [Thrips palmi]
MCYHQPNTMDVLPQDPSEQTVTFFDVSFTCPIAGCHKEFTKTKTYRSHRVKAHGLPRFNCIVCKAPFDTHPELIKHMYLENHVVACTLCNLKFRRPGEATSHYNQKHKQFTCGDCSLNIRGEIDLKAHLQFHNQERSPFNAAAFVEVAISPFSSDLPSEIQLMQDDSRDLSGSVYFPIDLDDDSNVPPDSTTQIPSTISKALMQTADSSTMACSDTDTADTESCSDSEIAPSKTSSQEIEDCRGSSESPLETAQTKTSSFDAGDSTASSVPAVETNATKTSSFEAGNSQGSSESSAEAVVFGPGASELFNGNSVDQLTVTSDSPQLLSLANKEDDGMEWIGHNVDMYQSMSEKHKKTYRYNCSKCSCTFKNKDILRRHLNIHDFICKVCFLRFNSLGEYKNHLKEQHSKLRTYPCSNCGHSLQGLKSLMVHEMIHRLNLAFKREAEDALQLDLLHRTLKSYECKFCKERIEGFSKFVRHAVWHNWESMWSTYVAGRIFKGTFTEDEANKFGREVEEKLGMKWRDCCNKKVKILESSAITQAVKQTNTTDKTDSDNVVDVSNESEIPETAMHTDETEAKSDTTVEISLSIDDWMDYWNSYLGIDESSPSWVKPFVKNLQMQWKSFKTDQLGCLYKQMDQIGMLLLAQKNGTSSVGPTVSIERLPPCFIDSKEMHNSSVKNLIRRTHSKVTTPTSNAVCMDTLSTLKSQKTTFSPTEDCPGPASVKRARSFAPKQLGIVKKDLLKKRTDRAINSFLKCLVSEKAQVWKPPSAREGSKDKMIACASSKRHSQLDTCEKLGDPKTQTTCGSPISAKECRSGLMRPLVVLSRLDWIKPVIGVQKKVEPTYQVGKISKPVVQVEKMPEAVIQLEKMPEAVIQLEKMPEAVIQVDKMPEVVIPVEKMPEAVIPVEKMPEAVIQVEKMPEPVIRVKKTSEAAIRVAKMSEPVIRVEKMTEPVLRVKKMVEPVIPVKKITNAALPCNTSDFLQMVAWTQIEIGCEKVPDWAMSLIDIVYKSSQPEDNKLLKMYQIRDLIKIEHGENGSKVQRPVVKLMRLR